MKSKRVFAAAFLLTILFCPTLQAQKGFDGAIETDIEPIKDVFKDDFLVGAAVDTPQLFGAEGALLRRHFDSLTAEYVMKFKTIHPSEGVYNFGPADTIAAFARRYGMKMRGHTFVWHHPDTIADWMFFRADGTRKSREEALAMLEDHMRTLMERYGDVVTAWDVVNEAIDTEQPDGMRRTPWFETVGPDYVEKAFEIAHRIDPHAKLIYNDYDFENPAKRDAIFKLVKGLLDKGIHVDGVGMQMHFTVAFPDISAVKESIEVFKTLGIEIHVTELDMTLYSQEFEVLDKAPENYLIHQAHRYKDLFALFRANKDAVTWVTLWGFYDGYTYLTRAPYNRPDWPLPFDASLKSKLAYLGIVQGDLPPDVEIAIKKTAKTTKAHRGTPVIDGEMDEIWKNAEVLYTDVQVLAKAAPVASVRILWDDKYLYFLAEVPDPVLNAKSKLIHEQDSFEAFTDENNGKSAALQNDDYQYRVNYRGARTAAARATAGMITAKAVEIPGGYRVEMSVKLNTITGAPGTKIGLEMQVNDADDSAMRVAISKWNDPTNESWRNTSGWGTLELIE